MTQTQLPAYLVTRRLAPRMRSGAGFTTGRPIDTLRAGLARHHAECGCLGQIRIAHATTTLAQGIDDVAVMRGSGAPGKRVRLDAHSPGRRAPRARRDARLTHLDGDREADTR
ncbi:MULTISPECIES: hypothetical protein [Burkholderia]|uniref:Uncharacterized protein n=1 Tax=Burkholderia contaminans TaxID=488447 RepID=A0A6P2UZE6_9BURK|nr:MULTISPECIES: hypothetical protein [Burkholderia]OXJ07006.1 hypothetical protein CFB45_32820 [Burkholderia sp. HI2500]VWC83030.1 hypothetical protein BCO71171_00608 [Burkholderia contaminans]